MSRLKADDAVPLSCKIENNEYTYAVLKSGLKESLAEKLGCSESTIRNYLSAFVKVGVLKVHRQGAKGTFYSIGYWQEFPGENQNDKRKVKVNKFLNSKTFINLRDFKVGR